MKVPISLADINADPGMSVATSPFAPGKAIIKRASFPKGEVPPHLVPFQLKKGHACKGFGGVSSEYKGRPMPKVAVCVASRYGLTEAPTQTPVKPKGPTGRKPAAGLV